MNQKLQLILASIATFIIPAGAITYGALTAQPPAKPAASQTPSAPKPKVSLSDQLQQEQPTIIGVLTTAYPKAATDYTIEKAQLFGNGEWFGAILSYHGGDTMNRDTLRVLLQKKNGVWTLRSTPPSPLLTTKAYPDVPKSILDTINKPVSLP